MRCQFCHNPDTWAFNKGTLMSVDEILSEMQKNEAFYKDGGITATGGEPLVQIDFLTELFQKAKSKNIHTCLDSSGVTFNRDNPDYLKKIDNLLQYTNLVMLDIKHIDDECHKKLTGHTNKNILDFAKYLDEKNIPVWIRHVLVPGITTPTEYLHALGKFIGSLKNVKALDVLPYHTMAIPKYKQLGIPYPLENVPQATKEQALQARDEILRGIKEERSSVAL